MHLKSILNVKHSFSLGNIPEQLCHFGFLWDPGSYIIDITAFMATLQGSTIEILMFDQNWTAGIAFAECLCSEHLAKHHI